MESYKLVRDIPCASPSSVAGLDLREVVYANLNGTCLDPPELNLTTSLPEYSTVENKFNSLISRLLQQELREEMVNVTDGLRNGTQQESQVSSGRGLFGAPQAVSLLLILFQVQIDCINAS